MVTASKCPQNASHENKVKEENGIQKYKATMTTVAKDNHELEKQKYVPCMEFRTSLYYSTKTMKTGLEEDILQEKLTA